MRLGAHNSIAGGLHNAVAECVDIGGDALQMFCKNQRQFNAPPLTAEEVVMFKAAVAKADVTPVMVHDSYIINLGNPDPQKRAVSRASFKAELIRCEALGVSYLNFHPGSHVHPNKKMRDDKTERAACIERIAHECRRIMEEVPGKVKLVVENAAGQGTNVGSSWAEVGMLLDAIDEKQRTGVCVDTQHAWASGYDWLGDYDGVFDEFDDQVGLDRLVAFHLNDSKMPLGSRVDRHDTVGEGHLGKPFFARLMDDTRFTGMAGYLETPGGPASWAKELAWLRSL